MSDYYLSIPLYHVDLKENNQLFIKGEDLPESSEDGEWGGKGLYLWDNINNAKYWKKVHWRKDASKASIVKTLLKIKDDFILDLTEPTQVKEFEESIKAIAKRAQKSTDPIVAQKANYILDGAPKGYAINFYNEYLKKIYNYLVESLKLSGLYPSVRPQEFFKDDLVLNKYYNNEKERELSRKYYVPHVTIQSKNIYVIRNQELLLQREIYQEED